MDPHLNDLNSHPILLHPADYSVGGDQDLRGHDIRHQQDLQHLPWLSHHLPVPLEQFPAGSGPLVFEGFVPDQQQPQTAPLDATQARGLADQDWDDPRSLYPDPEEYAHSPSIPPDFSDLHEDATTNGFDQEMSHANAIIYETPKRRPRGRPSGGGGRGRRRTGVRGRPKGVLRGPRKPVEPSEQFTELHKEATNTFIDEQDYDKAQKLILEAIKLNPEVYSAHALLSEIFFAKRQEDLGIEALFTGAHVAHRDPEVWRQMADLCLERSNMDRRSALERARYCFTRLLELDDKDYDSRFQRAAVNRELGMVTKALKDLDHVLDDMPYNSSVLQQIAQVCMDIDQLDKPKSLYEQAMEARRNSGNVDDDVFGWSDLIVYVDLIDQESGNMDAIHILRRHARWLLGRESEVYWDAVEDDREWDLDEQQRKEVQGFKAGTFPVETYGDGLPLELRVKLGLFRLKGVTVMRDVALAHFEWLQPRDHGEGALVHDYPDLFLKVAEALNEVKEYEAALLYYEALREAGTYNDTDFWLGIASSSYVCGKKEQAVECYEIVRELDETCVEARLQLSKLYTARGDRKNAMTTAREALQIAENAVPSKSNRRKYERRDQRLAREAAEEALRAAYYKLPRPTRPLKAAPAKEPLSALQETPQSTTVQPADDENQSGVNTNRKERPPTHKRKRKSEPTKTQRKNKTDATSDLVEDDEESSIDEADGATVDRWQDAVSAITSQLTQGQEGRRQAQEERRQIREERRKVRRHRAIFGGNVKQRGHDEQISEFYSALSHNTAAMRSGDSIARNIWMECADALIDDFRHQKPFYTWERAKFLRARAEQAAREESIASDRSNEENPALQPDQDAVMPSIESDLGTQYCSITFADWLDVFLEYATLVANDEEEDEPSARCYEIIGAATDCNVWSNDPAAMFQIHVCWFTCALTLRDEATLVNKALRWFLREGWQFSTDAYRLFATLNLVFERSAEWDKEEQMKGRVFRQGPSQKFVFRTLCNFDAKLPKDYNDNGVPLPDFMRKGYASTHPAKGRDEEDEESAFESSKFKPMEMDVLLLTLYAQILYAGDSFSNALSYFYRAFALDPKNATVLLSISLCYIHEILKRQNDDRHAYLLQGLAFFEEYVKARSEWVTDKDQSIQDTVKQEIELNRARIWHMLGLSSLATRGYKKLLDSNPRSRPVDGEHFTMEAAYALSTIYAMSGDSRTARRITERWLVVE